MTKWWKTVFTDWYHNFGSTACQKMEIYSDLNISTWTVYEVPDWAFDKRDDLITATAQEYIKFETAIYATMRNRGRTAPKLYELVRTLNRSTEARKKNLLKLLNGEGVRAESGSNRLMQQPTEMQRRSSTTAVALGCRGVARRKNKRRDKGGKENDPWSYL